MDIGASSPVYISNRDMWRNEHDNGDYEDLDEGEVKAAIAAWEDYQSAVHRTEEMTRRDGVEGSGLQVEMHSTQIELFDNRAWEERREIRWVKSTIEQYLPTRPILAEDNGISVWKLKYDGDAPDSYFPTYVGLVDRHSLMQFKGEETRFLDNVRWSWQETSDPLCFRWKLPDDDFLPAGVAEIAAGPVIIMDESHSSTTVVVGAENIFGFFVSRLA